MIKLLFLLYIDYLNQEHLQKHTGADVVEKETLAQARDYIQFSSRTVNSGQVNAPITVVADASKFEFYQTGQQGSWNLSSQLEVNLHKGSGAHADMLDDGHVNKNAAFIMTAIASKSEHQQAVKHAQSATTKECV